MKIRTGFVSNSSSSSYVICVGRVIDEEKLKAFCDSNGLNAEIYTTKEALDSSGWSRPITKYGDKTYFRCESFDDNQVSIEIDPEADEKFVSICHCQDIGEDEDGPIEPDEIMDGGIYSLGEEHGVTNIETAEGYGRNG